MISFIVICCLHCLACQYKDPNEIRGPEAVIETLLYARDVFSTSTSYQDYKNAQISLYELAQETTRLPDNSQVTICHQLMSFPDEVLLDFHRFLQLSGLICQAQLITRIRAFWQQNQDIQTQTVYLPPYQSSNRCVVNQRFRVRNQYVTPGSYVDGFNLPYGHLALTFDDGPHPDWTPRLLNILDQRSAKATFFMTGQDVERYPRAAQQVALRGHSVGSHSYDHKRLNRLSRNEALSNISRGHNILQSILSSYAKPFFRFPFGASSDDLKRSIRRRLSVLSWNIDTRDWATKNPSRLRNYTLQQIKKQNYRGILLFHDVHEQTIIMMPYLLTDLARHGFCLVVFIHSK